jgi:hypothetical protein
MATAWKLPVAEITTPMPTPKNYPDLTLKGVPDVICEVKLIMKNPETGRARMPEGYPGAVVASLVSDTPITGPKLLTDEELASTSHHILKFTAAQEGKRVYVADPVVCYLVRAIKKNEPRPRTRERADKQRIKV